MTFDQDDIGIIAALLNRAIDSSAAQCAFVKMCVSRFGVVEKFLFSEAVIGEAAIDDKVKAARASIRETEKELLDAIARIESGDDRLRTILERLEGSPNS